MSLKTINLEIFDPECSHPLFIVKTPFYDVNALPCVGSICVTIATTIIAWHQKTQRNQVHRSRSTAVRGQKIQQIASAAACTLHNVFFHLSHYQDPLQQLYQANPGFIQPDICLNKIFSFVGLGLQNRKKGCDHGFLTKVRREINGLGSVAELNAISPDDSLPLKGNVRSQAAKLYSSLSFSQLCEAVLVLVRASNKMDKHAVWSFRQQGNQTMAIERVLYTILESVQLSAYLLSAIVLKVSRAVYQQLVFSLALEIETWEHSLLFQFIPPGGPCHVDGF